VPKSKFTYAIDIATTAETLWKALLEGEFTRRYWGYENSSDWQEGSEYGRRRADATRAKVVLGEVIEASAPHRLVIARADSRDNGKRKLYSRVTFEVESLGNGVQLTITHDVEAGSQIEEKSSNGGRRVPSEQLA
jgi:uncharacterized protein YndB with AHSA1/START domain